MIPIRPLLGANNTSQLQDLLHALGGEKLGAVNCVFLSYNRSHHHLHWGDKPVELSMTHQPGKCALLLQRVEDQDLPWPSTIAAQGSYQISYPLFHEGTLQAVLCLSYPRKPESLPGLEAFLQDLGALAARVIREEQQEQALKRTREFLIRASEAQCRPNHLQRCHALAAALAEMLDLSAQVAWDLGEAARYHDVGLLTFAKPTSAEALQDHGKVGAGMLRHHPGFSDIALMVHSHHERYDGSGRPDGKEGDELPLECWVLAIVEDFVEFWEGSHTTYQSKIREYFLGPAKHHHPDVVDALCGLVDSGRLEQIL